MKILLEKIKLEDDYCPACSLVNTDTYLVEDLLVEGWSLKTAINNLRNIAGGIGWCGNFNDVLNSFNGKKTEQEQKSTYSEWRNTFTKFMQDVLEYYVQKSGWEDEQGLTLDKMKEGVILEVGSDNTTSGNVKNFKSYVERILGQYKKVDCKAFGEWVKTPENEPEEEVVDTSEEEVSTSNLTAKDFENAWKDINSGNAFTGGRFKTRDFKGKDKSLHANITKAVLNVVPNSLEYNSKELVGTVFNPNKATNVDLVNIIRKAQDNAIFKDRLLCTINSQAFMFAMTKGRTDDYRKAKDDSTIQTKDFPKLKETLGEHTYSIFINNFVKWDQLTNQNNTFMKLLKNFNLNRLSRDQFKYLYNLSTTDKIDDIVTQMIEEHNSSLEELNKRIEDNNIEYKGKKKGAANKEEQAEIFKKAAEVYKNQFNASEKEIDEIIKKVKKGEK